MRLTWYDIRGYGILRLSYRRSLTGLVRFVRSHVGRRHLDIASGSGLFLALVLRGLDEDFHEVIASDVSPVCVSQQHRLLDRDHRVRVHSADAAALPFPDDSFDSASVVNALHCLSDPGAALREARRVLKPGGRLALNALLHPRGRVARGINAWGMRRGILWSPFGSNEVTHLVRQAGFHIESVRRVGNTAEIVAAKP